MHSGFDGVIRVAYSTDSRQIAYAVRQFSKQVNRPLETVTLDDVDPLEDDTDVDVIVVADAATVDLLGGGTTDSIGKEGFRLAKLADETLCVSARDDSGAMYGVLDLAERIRSSGDVADVEELAVDPAVEFRAIKFNLPWSPYRGGAQTEIHSDTCRDLSFWESFLDMMARNRFNALTLWSVHPFPFMIGLPDYPNASPLPDEELAQWKAFWHELFHMASDRGIETYVVTWNIVVPETFADEHDVERFNDTSDVVRKYTRACITQVINEYENLTGVGTTLSDWMGGMTPKEKQMWLQDTFVEGMSRADRPVKFLNRSVRTNSIDEMRDTIDVASSQPNISEVLVPSKFNWSHGHSTANLEMTHDYRSGEVDDQLWNPEPENYRVVWTVRNEDFFILRWGDPEYVREHIEKNHKQRDYVSGYIVGSEAYIPAKDFSHKLHRHRTWTYAFEKQWLFYAVWGRLLYDPTTPDRVFERAFETRYGAATAELLLEGYKHASRMPLALASFHAGTWDYSLYSEGFLAPVETRGLDDEHSPFISINELIDHEPLASNYLSIPDYVDIQSSNETCGDGDITPLDLAGEMERTGRRVLEIVESIESHVHSRAGALECEVADLLAWGHLSLYFAAKVRAGVYLETYRVTGKRRKENAVDLLRDALQHWDVVVEATEDHYREVPFATDLREGETFSWKKYRDQLMRDIRIAQEARPYSYERP